MRNRFDYFTSNIGKAKEFYIALYQEIDKEADKLASASYKKQMEYLNKLYWLEVLARRIAKGCKNEAEVRRVRMMEETNVKKNSHEGKGWILPDGTIVNIDPYAVAVKVDMPSTFDENDLRTYFEPNSIEYHNAERALDTFLEEGNIYFTDNEIWIDSKATISKKQAKALNRLMLDRKIKYEKLLRANQEKVFTLRVLEASVFKVFNTAYTICGFLEADIIVDFYEMQKIIREMF